MGKIDSPGQLEVIESFNGQLSVEHFKRYVEKNQDEILFQILSNEGVLYENL